MIPLGCIDRRDDNRATYLSQNTLSGKWMKGGGAGQADGCGVQEDLDNPQLGVYPNVKGLNVLASACRNGRKRC